MKNYLRAVPFGFAQGTDSAEAEQSAPLRERIPEPLAERSRSQQKRRSVSMPVSVDFAQVTDCADFKEKPYLHPTY